jgi:hypothetical protein
MYDVPVRRNVSPGEGGKTMAMSTQKAHVIKRKSGNTGGNTSTPKS